jgi:hypothetical protein
MKNATVLVAAAVEYAAAAAEAFNNLCLHEK